MSTKRLPSAWERNGGPRSSGVSLTLYSILKRCYLCLQARNTRRSFRPNTSTCYNLRLGKHVTGGHMTRGAPCALEPRQGSTWSENPYALEAPLGSSQSTGSTPRNWQVYRRVLGAVLGTLHGQLKDIYSVDCYYPKLLPVSRAPYSFDIRLHSLTNPLVTHPD